MKSELSRRGLVVGAVGGAAVVGLGVASVVSSVRSGDVARAILHRVVGPFRMADTHLDAVIYVFERREPLPNGWKGALLRLAEAIPGGVAALAKAPGPGKRHEEIERGLLTTFMMTTNYLEDGAAPAAEIVFTGVRDACSSPFAVLTPP
jgi:hypothetical protein